MPGTAPRPNKEQRAAAAREKARQAREAALKAQKRKSLWTKIGVIGGIVVIVLAGVFIYYQGVYKPGQQVADQGPVPANANQYGGVTLTSPTTVVESPGGAQVDVTEAKKAEYAEDAATADKVVPGGDKTADPAQVIIYADVLCPHCQEFETEYASKLEQLLTDKEITLEYRFVSVIQSTTNYPARGANALYCVAAASPSTYLNTITALYADQKERSNNALADLAIAQGAPDSVRSCIKDGTYRPFAVDTQAQMIKGNITGTPSVFVNGTYWDMETDSDFSTWLDAQLKADDK